MITSVNRKSGMKAESENKKHLSLGSLNKKVIENIPEINSKFFENSLDAMIIGSQDGQIFAANPAACRMLDRDEKEICYLGRKGVVEETSQLYNDLKKRKESGMYFGELTVIRGDGTRLPVEVSSSVFTDSDGRELTTIIARDITERKKNEEALEEREAEYRSLFENSIMGISQTYPDGRYKRINKAYAEMYGYPDTSTMMKELSSGAKLFSDPDDRKRVLEILDKSGYMPPTEFELNRRNGEKFWAVVSAKKIMDNDGKLLYLQADHRDITRQKKLEKEMYSASLYARSLIEVSLDPLVTINAEGKVTDVNISTEKITGISRDKLIGSDFADYFSDPEQARKGYKIVFSKGVVKDYPVTIIHKNGKKIDVLYNATLFKDEAGKVQGVFAAARDITELKRIEKDLRKSKELLEKLNQHMMDVRENERNEIALNLHDDLGQKLTAINLDIAWLKLLIFYSARENLKRGALQIRRNWSF